MILVTRQLRTQLTSNGDKKFFLNLGVTGVSMPVRVPLILLQRKRLSRIAHWEGNLRSIKVTLEFMKGRLSGGSEVQGLASA